MTDSLREFRCRQCHWVDTRPDKCTRCGSLRDADSSLFHHGPWVTCRMSRVIALYVVGIILGFAGGFAMATLMWGLNNVIPR